MNEIQLAKAMGNLTNVALSDLGGLMVNPLVPNKPRKCLHPDHPDDEIAGSDPGNLAHCLDCDEDFAGHLITSHSRMLLRSTGSGSWPPGCDPDHPGRHVATFHVDRDRFTSHFTSQVDTEDLESLVEAKVWGTKEKVLDLWSSKSMLDVAIDLFVETYRRVGILHKEVADESDANILISMKRIPGNVIGFAYFNNATCSDQVEHWLDRDYTASLRGFTQLLSHEAGHNNNLEHEFRREGYHKGIMSYTDPDRYYGFSTGQDPHVLPRDPSLDDLADYYGTEPFPLDEPDDPVSPGPDPAPQVGPRVQVEVGGFWVEYSQVGSIPGTPPKNPDWEV